MRVMLVYCYGWKGSRQLEKWSHHVCCRVLFSIILLCGFQGEGQGKPCQQYPLLQAHLDRWDADNYQIENYSVTKHHLYSGKQMLHLYLLTHSERVLESISSLKLYFQFMNCGLRYLGPLARILQRFSLSMMFKSSVMTEQFSHHFCN
jgi:hypothetical protein